MFDSLRKSGIGVNVHYIPIYRHSYYKNIGFKKGYCIEAENFFQEVITLPIFPNLYEPNQEFIIENIIKLINNKV